MITLNDAIISLRPDKGFVLRGDTVDGVEWIDEGVTPLTEAEVAAEITRLEKAEADKATADAAATAAAVAHAKSLGFTDAMIAVMYPNLAP